MGWYKALVTQPSRPIAIYPYSFGPIMDIIIFLFTIKILLYIIIMGNFSKLLMVRFIFSLPTRNSKLNTFPT